jgi:hypothetical protein
MKEITIEIMIKPEMSEGSIIPAREFRGDERAKCFPFGAAFLDSSYGEEILRYEFCS